MHQGQIEQMANMGLQLAAEYQDASDAMPSGGYVFKVLFNGKDGMLGFRNWGEVDNFLQGKECSWLLDTRCEGATGAEGRGLG